MQNGHPNLLNEKLKDKNKGILEDGSTLKPLNAHFVERNNCSG